MPRKPPRRVHLRKPQPITFSRFGRSMALVTPVYKVKRQIRDSESHRKPSSSSPGISAPVKRSYNGNRFDKTHANEEKSEQPDSSSEEEFEGVVQVDFDFFDPKPDDFHGVKVLLQTYLDHKEWDLSGFVDLILGQTTVGTVIKTENDEDDGVFAVISALNLQRYTGHKCIRELKEFLLESCQDRNIVDDLRSYLGEQALNVGLLISQHVLNLPPQLLPPLHDALFDEVSWANIDEPTEELRKSFCFKSYLIVSRMYKRKDANQKRQASSCNEEAIVYVQPEDEIFHDLSTWSFSFPLRTRQVVPHELKNYRAMGLVMAVKASKVPTFREQLRSLID